MKFALLKCKLGGLSDRQRIDSSWRGEGLVVLGWALGSCEIRSSRRNSKRSCAKCTTSESIRSVTSRSCSQFLDQPFTELLRAPLKSRKPTLKEARKQEEPHVKVIDRFRRG